MDNFQGELRQIGLMAERPIMGQFFTPMKSMT
jgi:hypothetical protein